MIPCSPTDLPPGEVCLWCACLDEMGSHGKNLERTLSREEQSRANRFRFERDRVRYITGLGILRSILGNYLDVEPEALEFRPGHKGKPALSSRFGPDPIRFNMSRSNGLALYAFSRDRDLGVDVEKVEPAPEMDQLVERFFSKREIRDYHRIPAGERTEAFFRGWTRKEAFLKATGEGLFRPLDTFSVSLRANDPTLIVEDTAEPPGEARWSLSDPCVGDGYAAALVVRDRLCSIHPVRRISVSGS